MRSLSRSDPELLTRRGGAVEETIRNRRRLETGQSTPKSETTSNTAWVLREDLPLDAPVFQPPKSLPSVLRGGLIRDNRLTLSNILRSDPVTRSGEKWRSKGLVAWCLSQNTSVGQKWIAKRLGMGDPSNGCRVVHRVGRTKDPEVVRWKKELGKSHEFLH
jgi:hypothetical protein